jgi:hypothetical protein
MSAARTLCPILTSIGISAVGRDPGKRPAYGNAEVPAAVDERPHHAVAPHMGSRVYERVAAQCDTARLVWDVGCHERRVPHPEPVRKQREALGRSATEVSA